MRDLQSPPICSPNLSSSTSNRLARALHFSSLEITNSSSEKEDGIPMRLSHRIEQFVAERGRTSCGS